MPARIAKYFLVPLATAVVLSGLLVLESRAQVDVNAVQNQIRALRESGRHAQASALAEQFVPYVAKMYGQGGREHADALNQLGLAYATEGRTAEAIKTYEQSLAMAMRAYEPNHWFLGMITNNLADQYEAIGKLAEAEALLKQSIAVLAQRSSREDQGLLTNSLNNLGRVYLDQGRLRDAEPLFERALPLAERQTKDPSYLAIALNNLGELREKQGRSVEAEQLMRRSQAVREKAFGPNHQTTARGLTNLATFYETQGRISEAYPLLLRSLEIQGKILGSRHPEVTRVLGRLAANQHLYRDNNAIEFVEKTLKEQLAHFEKQGTDTPQVDEVLRGLNNLYRESGRYQEQEPVLQRMLAYAQKVFGRDSYQVGNLMVQMGSLQSRVGRHKEGLDLQHRAMAILDRHHGEKDHGSIHYHGNLAVTHIALKDWKSAAAELRKVVSFLAKRERGAELSRSASTFQQGLWLEQAYTHGLIQVLHRLSAADPAIIDESFQTAQLALLNDAGASVARMSARVAAGDDALANLVRERQDLVAQRTATDQQLFRLAVEAGKKQAAPGVKDALNRSLAELDAKLNRIDARIRSEYPNYASVSDPEPLTVKAAQAVLRAEEALVVFLDAPVLRNVENESYVWTITKTDVRWARLPSTPQVLAEKVRTLRCGLDLDGEWELSGDRWVGRNKPCQELRPAGLAKGEPLPFELARSHELYKELFGASEGVLKNANGSWKRLIVVPSASLAALPFQVLVTEPPGTAKETDYAAAKWLIARQAVSVLPSVVSLKALREVAQASKATGAFLGFGNPLIHGAEGNDKRAWQRQTCNAKGTGEVRISVRRVDRTLANFYRGELADVEALRAQGPLPETTDELCQVAASLNAGNDAVYLGAKATERTIKTLSANGTLARARILHFATHGLLASESKSVARAADEPALLLTPPRKATEDDDGLLTASEVAQLRLDADWVVLSACNTAGGGSTLEAEPLSGLARAFFYAGTRAILVSHWYVDSEAAVALVTKTFGALEAKPDIGRAEALRQSMLAMIDKGGGKAHPAQWAPFVVVGEGAR